MYMYLYTNSNIHVLEDTRMPSLENWDGGLKCLVQLANSPHTSKCPQTINKQHETASRLTKLPTTTQWLRKINSTTIQLQRLGKYNNSPTAAEMPASPVCRYLNSKLPWDSHYSNVHVYDTTSSHTTCRSIQNKSLTRTDSLIEQSNNGRQAYF